MATIMTKRQENIRLKKYEKYLEKVAKPSNDALAIIFRYVKKEIKRFTNYMMYRTRPSNKFDRFADNFLWWFIIVVIYFALEGFFYKITGR